MGSVIKTISLDVRTALIAETIPNFSQWIRAKLLELEEKRVTPSHVWRYDCDDCDVWYSYGKKLDWFYCRECNKELTDNAQKVVVE